MGYLNVTGQCSFYLLDVVIGQWNFRVDTSGGHVCCSHQSVLVIGVRGLDCFGNFRRKQRKDAKCLVGIWIRILQGFKGWIVGEFTMISDYVEGIRDGFQNGIGIIPAIEFGELVSSKKVQCKRVRFEV